MSTESTEEGLKRVIGVPGLTLSIINGVIGAGIFALPGIVGTSLGAFGIYAYIFCGIMLFSIMLCYAEIGSRTTTSGGSYAYVENSLGDFPGYLVNWLYFFGWGIVGSAALMNILADSLAVMFPLFNEAFYRGLLFLFLTGLMITINVFGAKLSVGIVKLITIIKLIPLFGIIILGFSYIDTANLHWDHLPSTAVFSNTALVLFFAFAGFETSLGASGEIKNSKRTVPLSLLMGGLFVLIIYLLLQTIAQGILGSQMAQFKDAPLAAVADKIIGPAGATILLACAAISCFGTVTLDILCTPRSLFAGANKGLFPKFLGRVHPKFATPYLAVFTYGTLIIIFSVSGGFRQLVIISSACVLIVYLAVILATIKLKLKDTDKEKGFFKIPGGLVIPLIGVASIVWVLTSLGKREILFTLLFIFIVSIFYLFNKWTKPKIKSSAMPG
ncbi:MAG: amino acid permease [Chitinophagaceae bacterium]|nr:amino acid permease [Chitinophagaceae bacterium]